jgi:predicted dehydrogenase/threonine dehydrogenase-like Zn-dependent dehydrogenase
MRQIVRKVIDRKDKIIVTDLPEPHLGPDQVLVRNHYSLISSGTELSTLSKTPMELVKQTLSDPWMRHVIKQTIFATGLRQTIDRIWKEMIMPREIGYSGAGRVLSVGERVEGFNVGDAVAYAAVGHAEIVAPSVNHVVSVPDSVDLRHAAFVTVGGIAVQALRRADLQFGETIAVYGLGLVGEVCAMIAKAAGCIVVGIDVNPKRNQIATANGVDLVANPTQSDWKRRIMDFTEKHGVDATIICASSKSDDIINSSMEITRKQGRVVILGYVGLNIHPKNFLYREIDLRYSRAYGPGSYHNAYEKGRVDYPFGYVRWTEKRNLQEFIRIVKSGRINLESLISGTYRIEEAQEAFDELRAGTLRSVAALIAYDIERNPDRSRTIHFRLHEKRSGKLAISIVGCGNHVLGKHLPHIQSMADVELRGIVSATGKNATMVREKYKVAFVTTDIDEVLRDQETDCVMICSSQHEHYDHVTKTIEAGKAVFVEKPMVTRLDHLQKLYSLMSKKPVLFTLGLNRRYSPYIRRLRDAIEGPIGGVTYIVAVPFVPPDHWTLDETEGAGRLITEGEHFFDLCHVLIGHPPIAIYAHALGKMPDDIRKLCNFAVTIHYQEAFANIVFNESEATGYPREKITVLGHGQVAVLDDFAKLTVHGKKIRSVGRGWKADMGHAQELKEFIAAYQGKPNVMLTWEEASMATLCMFAAQESIRTGEPVDLREFRRRLTGDLANRKNLTELAALDTRQ